MLLATQPQPITPRAPAPFSGPYSTASLQQPPSTNDPLPASTSSNANIQSSPAASHPAIPPVKTLGDAVKQWLYGDEQELRVPLKNRNESGTLGSTQVLMVSHIQSGIGLVRNMKSVFL